ncbi:MAG: hypothetical protein IJI44_06300 [Erysipelotrichaceae bacterium]|nr:hypothetical protein [Erysipelotrichaceae bacterium]
MERFDYADLHALCEDIQRRRLDIPCSVDTGILKKPYDKNGIYLKNRILAQPVEGFDANDDGSPSDRTFERYTELARGGAGCLWLESTSVDFSGRSNRKQLWITEDNWEKFRELTEAIRKASDGKIYLVLQLTHSGRYSNPEGIPKPIVAFHSEAIKKENEYIISDEELDRLEDDYIKAVKLAEKAGFDAVDIRACHGYLLNELFAAYDRPGKYGGPFENRTRLFVSICKRAMKESGITVGVRLNMYDGVAYPYGWGCSKDGQLKMDLEEALRLIGILYSSGIRLFNVTNGIGACSPFMIRPYDSGGPEPAEHQLEGIERMQVCAKLVKQHAPEAAVVVSGLTWLREYSANVAAGGIENKYYDIAGFGRQSIAYPGFANDILKDGTVKREHFCRTCCGCTNLIKVKKEELVCVFKEQLAKEA